MHTPLKSQARSTNPSFSLKQCHDRSAPAVDIISPSPVVDAEPHSTSSGQDTLIQETLDLSGLQNFEIVMNQYRDQGIEFSNAIALQPSNPAFPSRTGPNILLAGPKSGTMDLIFLKPISALVGYVTSASVTVMTAFDCDGQILGKAETLGRNLADEDSTYPPNVELSVATKTPVIHRVRLRCGGGTLALSDLGFSGIKRVHL